MNTAIKYILKDKLLITIVVIVPIITTVLYSLIYRAEIVEEIPIAVTDYDGDELSRQLIDMFDASPSLRVIANANSINQIKDEMIDGNIEATLVIPEDFSKSLKKGKNTEIVFYKNSQNIILSNILLKEAATITEIFSSKVFVKKALAKNLGSSEAIYIAQPIKIDTHSLYNPNYSYLNYLVPGLVLFTLHFAAMLSGAFVHTGENTADWKGSLERFVIILSMNILTNLIVLYILLPLLNVEIGSNIGGVMLLILIATVTLMNIGFALSLFVKNKYNVFEALIFYATPAFVFSGLTFPTWGMPKLDSFYSDLLPFTYYLEAFLKLSKMNSSINNAASQLSGLIVFLLISLSAIGIKYFLSAKSEVKS